jgi:hypothetical protein
MAEFKLPDPKRTSGKVLGLLVLAGLGLLTYAFILPFLLTVVWGTIQLAIGALVLAVLGYILTNPRFWKRLRIILDTFGEMLFKGFVEMNPFTILELQLKKAEDDREQLKVQAEKLKAQQSKLEASLFDESKARALAEEKMKICQQRVNDNPQDFEAPLQLESVTNDWTNSNDYIEKVSPICSDITKLTEIVDKAYRKSGYALKDAKNTVIKQRATYDAVTTGSNAMKKALLAFSGDPEMNRAGAIALEALKKDISNKVGIIKNSIQLTNQLMNERDLNDAAKVSLAVKKAQALDVDGGFKIPEPSVLPETIKLKAN